MSLELIVGPPNSGRAGEIHRRLEAALGRDPVLVVPTLDDADRAERELVAGGRALLGASITTFRGLTDEISAAVEAPARASLSDSQRLAMVRAAARETELRILSASAARAGFAAALERTLRELQAALVAPADLDAASRQLADGGYEGELARLYASYLERRDAAGRDDGHSAARRVAAALRENPRAWEERPVLLYGFDDLTEEQLELVEALSRACEVTVAVNYEDREALAARAELLVRLRDELGGETAAELPPDATYALSETLRALDRGLFELEPRRVEPDDGLVFLECAGELGEAEAVGGEIARLLSQGVAADDILLVLRHPDARAPLFERVLAGFGIPVAAEARVPLSHTAAGRGVIALARASATDGTAEDFLSFLRAQPGGPHGVADWTERHVRREGATTADEATARWKSPSAVLSQLRNARSSASWLRTLARAARQLAEEPHARREPVHGRLSASNGTPVIPFEPLEVRAAIAAAATLEELADLEKLPGLAAPSAAETIQALDEVRVPLWRGPTEGRVRILSPYRARAARARHLFLASLQDGEFPGAQPIDPLLGEERRAALGFAALTRRDPALEERYLFHACVSRPTECLWLSWRNSDEEGRPATRSPFVDDVLDLLLPSSNDGEKRVKRTRGLEQVVFAPDAAPGPRELSRALAATGPRAEPVLPGPLLNEAVLTQLAGREAMGAGTLERWIECPYRWFVDHELKPQRIEPEPEPLTLGSMVHEVLERLYREPPGEDRIPRPGDLGRWRKRAAELLDEAADRRGLERGRPLVRVSLAKMRAQIERLLERESLAETSLRPKLMEASFGDEEDADVPALDLGDVKIHGQIDRVDVTPDGRRGLVYDYKTGSSVTAGAKLSEEGKLQLQLYARALGKWDIEPLGGLYYQLGGSGSPRPRGFVVDDDEGTEALDLVRNDRISADDVADKVEVGVRTAREKAVAMRAGRIGRYPNRGKCPTYCHFQAICRLERSVGAEEEENGGSGAGA